MSKKKEIPQKRYYRVRVEFTDPIAMCYRAPQLETKLASRRPEGWCATKKEAYQVAYSHYTSDILDQAKDGIEASFWDIRDHLGEEADITDPGESLGYLWGEER